MKKWVYILALLATFSTTAQNSANSNTDAVTAAVRTMTVPKTEWLSPFNKVEVDGAINIVFKRVESDEGLKIVYDTNGNTVSRFRAGVDKKWCVRDCRSRRLEAGGNTYRGDYLVQES